MVRKINPPTTPSRRHKRQRGVFRLVCLLSLLFLGFACGQEAHFEQYLTINTPVWEKDKEYYFSFDIADASIPYDLTVQVRNNNLYPFQNLWLFIVEEQPSGTVRRDTLECILADDYGKWLGKGISLYESSFPLRKQYRFPEAGTYTIGFRQGMREEQLKGIQEIGMRVCRISN